MPGATPGDIPPPAPTFVQLAKHRPAEQHANVIQLIPRGAPPADPAPAAGSDRDADPDMRRLATWVAAHFRQSPENPHPDPERRLSLAEPETAAALRIAVDCISVLLDGALKLGELDGEGHAVHAYLKGVLADVRQAPDLI